MSIGNLDFLRAFDEAARAAQRAELAYRDEAAAGIARHERSRQFAFRRLNLARVIAVATLEIEDETEMLAAAGAALDREIGWDTDGPVRRQLDEPFRPVAVAVWRAARGETSDVAEAIAELEAWYERTYGKPFLALLDVEMPERPVVEF